jgi:hypothetical protein
MKGERESNQRVPGRSQLGRNERRQAARRERLGRKAKTALQTVVATAVRTLEGMRARVLGRLSLAQTLTPTGQPTAGSDLWDASGDWGDVWWSGSG